jgi:hypothetical protein
MGYQQAASHRPRERQGLAALHREGLALFVLFVLHLQRLSRHILKRQGEAL